MEQKMSLKSFSSRDDVLVNNYVFKFNKDLRVQANHIERHTFSKIEKKVAVSKFAVQYHLFSKLLS